MKPDGNSHTGAPQPGRRDFLRSTALGAAAVGLGAPGAEARAGGRADPAQTAPGDRPNVLLIMTDQHRADLMTCAGRDLVPTPHIDRIAERGVRFTHTVCPYPVCVGSRMALLSGLYAHTTGVDSNEDALDWRYRTMAHHFSDNGYLSALIGKMHFNDAQKHGFEYYLSINDWLMYLGPKARHYANEIANHPLGTQFFDTVYDHGAGFPDVQGLWSGKSPWVGNVDRWNFESMASPLDPDDHLDMFIARESGKFLRKSQNQPFFLVTSFMKPHSPFYPPREWAERYPIDTMDLPPVGDPGQYPERIRSRIARTQAKGSHRLKAHRAGYLGNLAFVDTCVGHVLDALDEAGLTENTIIMYTSDHGEMDGDHGLYQKFVLFEPAIRVPLIVSYPQALPQKVVTDALTEYIGIGPTLADLAGLDPPTRTTLVDMPHAPEKLDAASFADLIRHPDLPGPSSVFSEFGLKSATPSYMIRTRRYKYVYNDNQTHEMYDLEADPGEMRNLVNDAGLSRIRGQLHDELFAWYDPTTNPYRGG